MSGLSAIARQIFISLEIRTLWKADCLIFLCFDEAEYYCYYGHHLTWYLIVYYSNSMHKSNTSLYSECVVVSASLSHVFYPLHHSYILIYFLCCIIFHLCLCCIYTFFSYEEFLPLHMFLVMGCLSSAFVHREGLYLYSILLISSCKVFAVTFPGLWSNVFANLIGSC